MVKWFHSHLSLFSIASTVQFIFRYLLKISLRNSWLPPKLITHLPLFHVINILKKLSNFPNIIIIIIIISQLLRVTLPPFLLVYRARLSCINFSSYLCFQEFFPLINKVGVKNQSQIVDKNRPINVIGMFVKEVSISPNHLMPRVQSLNTKYHTVSSKLMRERTIYIYHTDLNIIKMRTKKKSRPIQYLIQR